MASALTCLWLGGCTYRVLVCHSQILACQVASQLLRRRLLLPVLETRTRHTQQCRHDTMEERSTDKVTCGCGSTVDRCNIIFHAVAQLHMLFHVQLHSKQCTAFSFAFPMQICSSCKGHLQALGRFNQDGTPAKARQPSQYSLFVKENFASHKKGCAPGTPHKEIMQALSCSWKARASASDSTQVDESKPAAVL